MKQLKPVTQTLVKQVRQQPILWGLVSTIVAMAVTFICFHLPKDVDLSYGEPTCTSELTLFPGVHSQTTDSQYQVTFDNYLELFGTKVAAGSVCFTPLQMPEPGSVAIATSPLGGWAVPQAYSLNVGDTPRVNLSALDQPVPVNQPIILGLDKPDIISQYSFQVGDKSADCLTSNREVACDIAQLDLEQGKSYDYQLMRAFAGTGSDIIGSGSIKTLKSIKLKKSSVKDGQTVYNKPGSFKLTFDKPIKSAEVSLKTGDRVVDTELKYSKKTVKISLSKQLERQKKYSLTVASAEAVDGSTLVEPHKIKFTMSGGPAVSNISIGKSRVSANARVILTFDQDLSSKHNTASLVSLRGGKSTSTQIGKRQVAVQLQGLGRCKAFTISVAGGAVSKYGIENKQGWKYNSRTICYTTSSYGTSRKGRSLIAYHFGNKGPVTLYTGAIHGNEISSQRMMQSWISELDANPGKLDGRRVVVIPSINPDGVASGTRNNSRDVNLNRNFPTDNWQKDIDDTDGKNKGGGGKKPLSEPEAAALASYTKQLNPRLLLSYHAVGSLVIGDGAGTYSGQRANKYANMVGYRNATGEGDTFDYSITGAYEDWTWRNQGIPSMTIELGSYSYHSFAHHRAAMWAMLN